MTNKENYKTIVRYYSCRTIKNQKYINIELPENSAFNIDDVVEISITSSNLNDFVTSVSTAQSQKRLTAGSIMRQMDIGDTATFNRKNWKTIRTIASQIKQMYGSIYSVRKDKHRPENIIVTRLS